MRLRLSVESETTPLGLGRGDARPNPSMPSEQGARPEACRSGSASRSRVLREPEQRRYRTSQRAGMRKVQALGHDAAEHRRVAANGYNTKKMSVRLSALTSVVRDEDRLPQQMIFSGRHHHRAAGVRRHVKFLDAQRIHGERVAMRWISLVRAGSVISVVSEIGAALHGTGRQNGAMLGTGALGELVDRSPAGQKRSSATIPRDRRARRDRITSRQNSSFRLAHPVHCSGGDMFPPLHPKTFAV
jgi:hypothetical protein